MHGRAAISRGGQRTENQLQQKEDGLSNGGVGPEKEYVFLHAHIHMCTLLVPCAHGSLCVGCPPTKLPIPNLILKNCLILLCVEIMFPNLIEITFPNLIKMPHFSDFF